MESKCLYTICKRKVMVSATPIIMVGDLILKFAKILWVQNSFLHLWGDKPPWGELKLYRGSNIYYDTCIISFLQKKPTPRKVNCFLEIFFRKCEYIRECYLSISSNLLKKSFKETSPFALIVKGVLEKIVLYISHYFCNSCDQNL